MTPDQIQEAVDRALSGVLADEGHMVNRWLALVEAVDSDGERGLWTFTADGMRRWDTLGLLHQALLMEQAEEFREGESE